MRRLVVAAGVLAVCIAAGYLLLQKESPLAHGVHYASHMQKEFYGDMAAADTVRTTGTEGAIVSHHLLMADDIARTFASMASEEVRTVVIIGPDHFTRNEGQASISRYAYDTPWGRVEPDLEVIDRITEERLANPEEYVFEIEHSISSLVPFVKYHFPNAKLVPIVLQRNTSAASSDAIAEHLRKNLPEDSIVIASVDFSHHLSVTAADFHDAKSIETVRAFDYPSLARLEVDSPASLRTVLKYLESKGAMRPTKFENTNSSRFLGIPDSDDVTSYLFATFAKGPKEGSGALSILAIGDAMLGRDVAKKHAQGTDLFERFRGVEGNFLKGFDIFIANLEGPITTASRCQEKSIVFSFEPDMARYLKGNAITHVNLSNNHTFDCFTEGLVDTKRYLADAGIRHVGGGSLTESTRTETINGTSIAILGLDRTIQPVAAEAVYAHIRSLEEEHAYTVIEVHWGIEYDKAESSDQRDLAHGMIDSGADAVIGHHPHVVQPVEIYKNRPIFYSLGNFIFDQIGIEMNTGIAAGLVFEKEATGIFLFPYRLNARYQPALMDYDEAQAYCSALDIRGTRDDQDKCVLRIMR